MRRRAYASNSRSCLASAKHGSQAMWAKAVVMAMTLARSGPPKPTLRPALQGLHGVPRCRWPRRSADQTDCCAPPAMPLPSRRDTLRLFGTAALAASAAPVWAQAAPPIRLVLGFPAGATSDSLTRIVGEQMAKTLQQ